VSGPAHSNDHVRLALASEAQRIAEVQRRAWDSQPDTRAGAALLAHVDAEAMVSAWTRAVTAPPAARYRVLVALADVAVVGFAVTRPSDDPDADPAGDGALEELIIDPLARRRGHGSRLLNAAIDTLRADGFGYARCWVGTTDDDMRRFLTAAGWATDGATREIGTDDESVRIRQVRLHTQIAEDINGGGAGPRR
jgi:ribosomal protein S18 acetylase RimI-like enzyme